MTGRLLVDGAAGIDDLPLLERRDEPAWDRVTFRFDDGGDLRVRDPRRLGGVLLDPDESRLGVDAPASPRPSCGRRSPGATAPLKARLMDQARLAGIGNLIVDEVLWRAGLDPARPAGSLTRAEQRRLHTHLRRTVDDLLGAAGSHTGTSCRPGCRAGAARGTARPLAAHRRGPHHLVVPRHQQ